MGGAAHRPSRWDGTEKTWGADVGRFGECQPHREFMVASPEPRRNAKAAPDGMKEARVLRARTQEPRRKGLLYVLLAGVPRVLRDLPRLAQDERGADAYGFFGGVLKPPKQRLDPPELPRHLLGAPLGEGGAQLLVGCATTRGAVSMSKTIVSYPS
jgi:hypothetical protein